VVIVGGGISAGQIALALAERAPGRVTLLTRRAIQEAHFETSACWTGQRCRAAFARTLDYRKRRWMIDEATQSGSMPPAVRRAIQVAVSEGRLEHPIDQVEATRPNADGSLSLTLASGAVLEAERVILATGFSKARPGSPWLDETIHNLGLRVATDGFPILNYRLEWCPGLAVSGPLAELELGPAAPNIVGAHLAAERLGW
ncbi:MAG: lysine N(6)-hydroxylase/L-ornithine N(5)-oxygenase family protein, partial [Chloroflexi bacterium]|nr:lysine N(6)-hydroxylase/L-ornithine N(5)-oxygenase family protein [Chloroflexota bacterium]